MLNLSLQSDREALEELISNDIDNFCMNYYDHAHRNHLGGSELGKPCWRMLWYKFRWVKASVVDGRVLRIFNVGHSAEPRFVTYLRGIGFEVKEFAQQLWYSEALNEYKILEWDADLSGGTGSFLPVDNPYHIAAAKSRGQVIKQFRISGAMGHYGGSLDGMCKAPARYNLETDLVLLNEFKTNNTGSGFNKVASDGVAKAKPEHFAQMSQYGYKKGLKYGLYLIENKNDSDITIKIVELDWNLGAQLEKKANDIIFSKEPPPRISENPATYECKYCDFSGICHSGEQPEKNCRSCRNSIPVENAEWLCSIAQQNIPKDVIPLGCPQWLGI